MRAATNTPEAGKPLPSPFPILGMFGAEHRRGCVSIVAAASGVGKTQYATYFAVHAKPAIPTLYFCSDSDVQTVAARVGASIVNDYVHAIETRLRQKDAALRSAIDRATSHIWYSWDSAPSVYDVEDETVAYALATGAWPHLIVIDNLINVDSDGDSGHIQKDGVLAWLQDFARVTNAHIMVLQHVTKDYENGVTPIPKSGLLDSVAKRPKLILTLYKVSENFVGVRIVKNSNGKMDATGQWGPDLAVMFEKTWMSGEIPKSIAG